VHFITTSKGKRVRDLAHYTFEHLLLQFPMHEALDVAIRDPSQGRKIVMR
jgi:hypothetical protein